jgi:hypothetical protein
LLNFCRMDRALLRSVKLPRLDLADSHAKITNR